MKNTRIKSVSGIVAGLFIALVTMSNITTEKPRKITTETFKVEGCCSDCKERIEDALDVKGIRYANWNKADHTLTVTFKTKAISLQEIHNLIAAAGHDTELAKAPDSVYHALPECCQYRGGNKCTH